MRDCNKKALYQFQEVNRKEIKVYMRFWSEKEVSEYLKASRESNSDYKDYSIAAWLVTPASILKEEDVRYAEACVEGRTGRIAKKTVFYY